MSEFFDEIVNDSFEWVFMDVDEKKVAEFSRASGFSKRISRIFLLKGICTEEQLKHFINDDIYELHNPFLFRGMLDAVVRTRKAVHSGERIFIFGDRDVDGVVSTAMLYNLLKRFGANPLYRVPEGEYGYGMEKKDIDFAKSQGTTLLITIDTGISSREEVEYARFLGIDTIIIDHHIPPQTLPEAISILNPKISGETYPFRELSAGGVALKFIHAFIISQTKNFNRVFIPVIKGDEKLECARVRNGLIEGFMSIEESIKYPFEPNDTIVTDHDSPLPSYFAAWLGEKKINRLSIVNPGSYGSVEEFAKIFIRLFWRKQTKTMAFLRESLDLAAISTVADIMPLSGENRIIVKEGLEQIKHTTNTGLKTLLAFCALHEGELSVKDIAWSISPVINSAGRMGNADLAVRLFITEDVSTACELSKALIEFNERRKEKGEKNLGIISSIVEDKYSKDPIIILSTDKAEHGVTGIIASKIARKYSRPAIIIVNDGKIGIGSGRSGGGLDLVSLVARCNDLLMKYGGHKSAVGFTIDTGKIDVFRERIHEIVMRELESFTERKVLEIYDVLSPDELIPELYKELRIFEPTGSGNPAPVFSILGTSVINPVAMGKEKNHIRFYIPAYWGIVPVVGWGFAEKTFKILEQTELVDIAFTIEENRFKGECTLQLVLHDIRPSGKVE